MNPLFGTPSKGSHMSVRARKAIFESGGGGGAPGVAETQVPHTEGRHKQRAIGSPGRRNPLGFLSPNFKKRLAGSANKKHPFVRLEDSTADEEGDSMALLRNEISSLQHRIQFLDSTTVKTPDGFIEIEDETELLAREEHLQELNQKLLHIQSGLQEIDDERCQLVHKSKLLEQEKRRLQDMLQNREKEIETLQQRCGANDDKIKESVQLRTANNELTEMVVDLSTQLHNRDSKDGDVLELKHQLRECEGARHDLMERLQTVKRDHDKVCENLSRCLANVEKLTEEKREWEEERRKVSQHTELQLEQQRLDHLQATIELRNDLKSREKKVHDLDRLLQEKIMTIQRLRRQLSNLEASQAAALKEVADEYERKLQEANRVHEEQITKDETDQKAEIADLQAQLESRGIEIETLRTDVANQMQELMTASSELHNLEDDRKMLDGLMEDVETLDHECFSLRETLHDKETAIAELTAEILKMEIEKELAEQDTREVDSLKSQLACAVKDQSSLQAKLKTTSDETEKVVQRLEKQLKDEMLQNAETIEQIRHEYDEAICEMQEKLQASQSAVTNQRLIHEEALSAKEKELAELHEKLACANATNNNELTALRDENSRLSAALSSTEEESRMVKSTQVAAKEKEINTLQIRISQLSSDAEVSESKAATAVESLESQVKSKEVMIDSLHIQIKELVSRAEASEKKVATASSGNERQLSLKDEQISSLHLQVDQLTSDCKESEGKAATEIVDLERRIVLKDEQMKSLQLQISRLTSDTKASAMQHANEIEGLEHQIESLRTKSSDLESLVAERARDYEGQVERMTKTISDLRHESATLQSEAKEKESAINMTETTSKQLKMEFASEVEGLERQIQQLQASETLLKKQAESIALQNSSETENLKNTITALQCEKRHVQTSLDQKEQQLEQAQSKLSELSMLEQAVADLRRENDLSKISLAEAQKSLDEEKAEQTCLLAKIKNLEDQDKSLQMRCSKLEWELKRSRDERSILATELEQEIKKQENGQIDALKGELDSFEGKLAMKEQEMATLEEALSDRTKLLDDMIDHNRELQAKVDSGDSSFQTMAEESSSLRVRLQDREEYFKRLRAAWKKTEDELLEQLHNEQHLRDLAETDLAESEQRFENITATNKDLSELAKENEALKDKIRRQEAYLKRKLEQDKVTRERKTTKTPARPGVRNAANSVRKPLSSNTTTATQSTVPDDESLDWELESLLAD